MKYLTFRQWFYRLKYISIKRYKRKIDIKHNREYNQNFQYYDASKFLNIYSSKACFSSSKIKADNIIQNRFTFLNNLTYQFTGEIDWKKDPFEYRLWSFNLNYFDYLDDLLNAFFFTSDKRYLDKGYALIDEWIKKNLTVYDSDLWDPYVTSKRLINWVKFISFCSIHNNTKITNFYVKAISTQLSFLKSNIEYYLGANHLIMDAKGLIFGGCFLGDDKAIKQGLKILRKEFTEQVLTDGAHYERSPSYQVEVIEHYLEAALVLKKNGYKKIGEEILDKIELMFDYLYNIIMPNGEIPLLNDSTLDYPMNALNLLECGAILYKKKHYLNYCKGDFSGFTSKLFKEEKVDILKGISDDTNIDPKYRSNYASGYYVLKDNVDNNQLYFLFDCGDCGPDYNLGHAHADSLNVILTIGAKKILVDSGTYTYKKCSERDYFRSTMAHNTISIDGKSSSQVWAAFRTAKRAKTKVLKYEEDQDFILITAEHNGFCKTLGSEKILHKRTIIYFKEKCFIIVDNIYGEINKTHKFDYNLYLGEQVEIIDKEIVLENDNKISIKTNKSNQISEAEISEYFSLKKKVQRLIVTDYFNKNENILTVINLDRNKNKVEVTELKGNIQVYINDKKYNFMV